MIMTNLKNQILVLAGIDSDDKPHAAWFAIADELLVRKAAQLMSFRIGLAGDDKSRDLARKLPEGKLFATGKALVPLVKHELYDKLLATIKIEPPQANPLSAKGPSNGQSKPPAGANLAPSDLWAAIKVGSAVLCRDGTVANGYWEAVVVTIADDGDTMTLRWRD
jgi:hypothetical protein